jgi:GNAT superfamily N-acetyltransferase
MITIREARRHDAAAISRLMVHVASAQISSGFSPEGQAELLGGMTPDAVYKKMQQGYRYHVAHDGEQLCGIIGMRGYSHVYHLFVATDQQGRGTGRRLWDRAYAASRAEVRVPAYTVYSSRYAENFYYRLGFRRTGDAQTRNGVTAIPMRLTIDEIKA